MWQRRQLLTFFGTVSGGVLAARFSLAQSAPPAMPGMSAGTMTAQTCIDSCWRSHVMCLETERFSLAKGGIYARPLLLTLLSDCADMCEKTADSLLRGSPQHAAICTACAQLCDACAAQCEMMKDDRLATCAKTCRACASHCRGMSKLPI